MIRALRTPVERSGVATRVFQPGSFVVRGFELLPIFVAASIPKCPLCLMGMLSSVGVGIFIEARWLLPLTLGFVGVSLTILAYRAWRRECLPPLLLGISGVTVFMIGRFANNHNTVANTGLVLLVVAHTWSSWPRDRARPNCSC